MSRTNLAHSCQMVRVKQITRGTPSAFNGDLVATPLPGLS
jgi:hypothetical protein